MFALQLWMQSTDWKVKVKLGNTSYGEAWKTTVLTVATLFRFHCGAGKVHVMFFYFTCGSNPARFLEFLPASKAFRFQLGSLCCKGQCDLERGGGS